MVNVTGNLKMSMMALPVLDDIALDVYQSAQSKTKRRVEPEASKIAPGVFDASLHPP